ncbi:MAG: helix-turn-helix transcriptional regulator [Hyphomicrobiaceae bacterium]
MPVYRGNEQETHSALIGAIYDAALDPVKWQDFVDALSCELEGVEPVLYLADRKTAVMETLLVSENWGKAFLADYMDRYNALNPWTPHLRNAPGLWEPIVGDQVITERKFTSTEFYNDFFKKYWRWSSVVGVVNYRDCHSFSVLGLHTTRTLYERHSTELCRLATELARHIARAFEISRQLQHGAARRASLELMLESLSFPALLIGVDLRVRYANHAAETSFRSGILTLDKQRCIATGAGAKETQALRLALTKMLSSTPTASIPFAIKLTRCDGDTNAAIPLLARILPCAGGLKRLSAQSPVPPVGLEPEAMLLLTDPSVRHHVRAGQLELLFGLTPAEARLAQTLAEGISIKGYAAAAGVAVGTARVQLKSVFAKTNTSRQAELVALLAQLMWPLQLA